MKTALPTLIAVASIVALFGWMRSVAPPASQANGGTSRAAASAPQMQEARREGGSGVPCQVPLLWRVARVDPEFETTVDEVTEIVANAAQMWEEAVGEALFALDEEDGFPIRLIYDERQESLDLLAIRNAEIQSANDELTRERMALDLRFDDIRTAIDVHNARTLEVEASIAEHNETIRDWNRRSASDPERERELQETSERLVAEQEALAADGAALQERQAQLRAAEAALNDRIESLRERAGALSNAPRPPEADAGLYRESVTLEVDGSVSVRREIRLYRLASPDELRVIVAHELGHALGIGHPEDGGGIMSATVTTTEPIDALAASDVALFREACANAAG